MVGLTFDILKYAAQTVLASLALRGRFNNILPIVLGSYIVVYNVSFTNTIIDSKNWYIQIQGDKRNCPKLKSHMAYISVRKSRAWTSAQSLGHELICQKQLSMIRRFEEGTSQATFGKSAS
jgi:hypothetical protein